MSRPDCSRRKTVHAANPVPLHVHAVNPSWNERVLVYGNSIHKPEFLEFYAFLAPDEFIFFDNGLSSYWSHDTDPIHDFPRHGIPRPAHAYLALHPPLPLPTYLERIPQTELTASDFAHPFKRMADASLEKPKHGHLPEHVILGTSLFRTNRISWDDERRLYLDLIAAIRQKSNSSILFKGHPRSSDRPLISRSDGVDVLETIVPIEAFAQIGGGGIAYSASSTSLFTLQKHYGFTARRLDSPAIQHVAGRMPHLDLVNQIPALLLPRGGKTRS